MKCEKHTRYFVQSFKLPMFSLISNQSDFKSEIEPSNNVFNEWLNQMKIGAKTDFEKID